MKYLKVILTIIALSPVFLVKSQVFLFEGFETGAKPDGWSEETVSGTEPWRYRNGGHSPNDNNWLVPPEDEDITRNPPSAYAGTYNAIFFKQGDNNERTKLITPEIDLLGATKVELSFYLCQKPWTFEGSTGWDVLRIYYKVSEESEWVLLHEYLDPVYDWELQTLVLPNPTSTYSLAFEGQTRWGYGTCIDEISIEEKGLQSLWISEMDFEQPFDQNIPSGLVDQPVMRISVKVYGNMGSALLDYINFKSLNTSDNDILLNGVKLYSTETQTFSTENILGSPTNFNSGIASFTGLNYSLPPGISYLWLAYDIDINVKHENILDVMVEANTIMANDTLYPAVDQSPDGNLVVYETRYSEDFEGSHNWSLEGEFEVNTPLGLGGSPGNPDPAQAYNGSKILGTDLTGLGANPYNYEPGLSEASSDLATSPTIDAFYYTNLNLFFQRQLNIEVWDQSSIEVSADNGTTWNSIWSSSSYLSDFQWSWEQVLIPNEYSKTDQLKLRYKLGPTDSQNNYSGWNIDYVFITGEFISKDVGISSWAYPKSGSGHSANDSVIVIIRNYGGAEITDQIPVAYSFDGGANWTVDNMNQNIPVGDSVAFTFSTKVDLSTPGLWPSVMAKTMLPGDQYPSNDLFSTQIYIVPTYEPPYTEDFELNEGYWRSEENMIWEYGLPSGSVINNAASGTKSWATGLSQKYGDILADKSSIIFEDNFESDLGWAFTEEFERNVPSNMFVPYFAYSGYSCIGTDISGQGVNPYNYENGITSANAYTAASPTFDISEYSNLKISYASWIIIQAGDSVKLEVSPNNGTNWYTLWKNTQGEVIDPDFNFVQFDIPDSLSYSTAMKFRFSLFYSSLAGTVSEGWNIDDFVLTGDKINSMSGILRSPSYDLTGITKPIFEASIWLDTEKDIDGATLYYSLDDGNLWTDISNISGFDSLWNWYTGLPVEALGLNGWSGQSNGWQRVRHILPDFVINKDNVQFKLEFMADKFNNQYDGIAIDDIQIFEAPHDVGIIEIINPVTACELSSNQKFTLRIKNFGVRNLQVGDSISVGYNIDKSGIIQIAEETIYLGQSLLVGATKDFVMTSEFDFSESGEYSTTVYTIEEDPFYYNAVSNDTISQIISVNKPIVDLGPDISTVRQDTVILKAYTGVAGNSYKWQDNSTDSVYHVNTEGTYYVEVTNSMFCTASDTVQILQLIVDLGVSKIISPQSACELGSEVPVQITIKNYGTDTLNLDDTIFVYREINQSSLLSDTIYLTERFFPGDSLDYFYSKTYDFSSPGIYHMKLYTRLTDDFTNINDSLNFDLEVHGYPLIDLGPDTVASFAEYLLEPSPGYFEYFWQDGSIAETFLVEQPGMGLYYVSVSDIYGCNTVDSVRVTLNVTDIEIDQILSPETSCNLSESIIVSARIKNAGNIIISSGQTINIAYKLDNSGPVEDIILLTENFLPGNTIDFEFSQTETVQTGQWYDFTVYTSFIGDMRSSNDTIIMPVGVFEPPTVDLGDDYQAIIGLEHTLDAGPGFDSYLWDDGSTNQTFIMTEPGIGTYSVTVTDDNGCEGFDEILIMLAVPDIGITEVVHPQTSCELGVAENIQLAIQNLGNWDITQTATITVTYSINGGSFVTENLVLNESFVKGTVIYYTFAGTEDFSAIGQYEIIAFTEYNSDLISSNDTLTVDVNIYGSPQVDIGSGEDTIVVIAPFILSAPPGFVSYQWQDGSVNSDYEVSTLDGNMYSVVVTADNGCATVDSVFVIYDVPNIGISRIVAPVTSCELMQNNPVSIEILNNGYFRISTDESITISYKVDGQDSVIETINLNSALQPGETTILSFSTGYDFSGIGSYQLDIHLDYTPDLVLSDNNLSSNVNVWGYPVVDIGNGQDTLRTTLPVTLDAGIGYSAYLWQDNSTGSSFEVTDVGLYWVMVSNENGCSIRDSVYINFPTNMGNWKFDEGQIKIYPNPASDILNVIIEMEEEKSISLEFYSILNTLIYREDFKPTQFADIEMNVQELPPGLYYLKVTADKIPAVYLIVLE